ncbi:magnesium transporter CorA family protein [Ciceribacter sp. L1K22]|uniref:magnesium transporter CorA family protein n=1 Tax=Ciceribacter sp. L1K22 TaxID=2820275 RepID=UPI001ABDD48A|nr:magnesium transporter CorA family protein [Ciceribacter sp. L1K22]MBO3759057.1 magnesium transporter CorA family protein [Ciceribacter sp. L1K22]
MIRAYHVNGRAEEISPANPQTELASDIVWLDLIRPDRDEEALAENLLGIPLPTRDDLKDIEPSSRLYVEDSAVYMTASLIWKVETELPELTDIAFILAGHRLVTIRYAEPRAFELFSAGLLRTPGRCKTGPEMVARLLETIVDRTAEILELAVARVDALSGAVFVSRKEAKRRAPKFLEDKLLDIASHHRLVSKARDSLVSLSRLVIFLRSLQLVHKDQEADALCRTVARDIQSLAEHAGFVANNITFMLDAALGLINVEQNAIIKIFSIASVVFLPPTLVASVYGMNFHFMPELDWNLGYPFALFLMLMSAVIPFLLFRWKGWL